MATTSGVDTRKVTDRRALKFGSPDDVIADVARLVAAERAGTLRLTGNWTLGQTLGHLAYWAGTPYDQQPPTPPGWVKILLRLMGKKKFISEPMRVGVRMPQVAGGTMATDVLPLDEGLARFTKAWERLKTQTPVLPNVIFGPLTHEEWICLNLRHAELHLSFMHGE